MKTFIINLKEKVQRRENIVNQCSELGLDYEIFPAINGYQLSETDKKTHTLPLNMLNTPGELGCALSHLFLYKKIIDQNIPNALILEDDALLNSSIMDILLFLEKEELCKPTVTLLTPISKYIENEKIRVNKTYEIYNGLTGTLAHGYVINNKGAHELYKFLYPAWSIADHWFLFKEYGIINLRGVIPHCIELSDHSFQSDIGNDRFTDLNKSVNQEKKKKIKKNLPIKLKIKRVLNKLKRKLLQRRHIRNYSSY
ncbi:MULTISPECIES: glycosyltransferase family 25 protein [unclassified Brenneria]|uniref:glycosyltransferase family 25 protein n=1 Tax=unclassified Brenneria TaxID=2634434 RepID=UPI001557ED56|nr:glycosyltransferase family 25 protein [Brenneria sp. hezel4-2-4]MEE3652204.1 glycosyltransferase family 25 protein [Brenneria sp. HEZEL_4_2_4]NPD02163.1 glycosyltransferase family 25 protein [Brenneria sp. hezel4-2-4]